MPNIDSNELSATEMTNIDSNALSDVELGAVSGGDYSFWPSAPSQSTVQKINAVGTAAAVVAAAPGAAAVALVGYGAASAALDFSGARNGG